MLTTKKFKRKNKMKKIVLILTIMLFTASLAFGAYVKIGTGTTATYSVPTNGLYDYSWSQVIYLQTEIGSAIDINKISYYVGNTPANHLLLNQKIYMKHTTDAIFPDATYDDPVTAGFTQVYDGNFLSNGGGWHDIVLDTPFSYDGTDNLIVYWQNYDGDYVTGYPTFRYTSTTNTAKYKYADDTFPEVTGSRGYYKSNIRLHYQIAGAPGDPTTPSPANAATGVAVSGNLTWDFGADTDTYDLLLGPAGSMVEVVTGYAAGASGSYAYSGLSYATGYEWQVIAHNATKLTTNGPIWSFTTEYPSGYLFESFEDAFPPAGWQVQNIVGNDWAQYSYGSPPDGSKQARLYYTSTTGAQSRLVTPKLSITHAYDFIDFYCHYYSAGTLKIQYSSDATTWTDLETVTMTTTFAKYTVDVSSLVTKGDYYLGFLGETGTGYSYMYLDAVHYPPIVLLPPGAPSNPDPADDDIDVSNTADLTWTNGFATETVDVYFSTNETLVTDKDASVKVIDNLNVETYDPGTMSYSTEYFWRVVCKNSAKAETDGPVWSFTTEADPTLTPPFIEDFSSWYPTNWSKAQGLLEAPVTFTSTTTCYWFADGFANVGTTGAAKCNVYSTNRKEWMITPPIDLGAKTDYQLEFDLALTDYGNTNPPESVGDDDKYAVIISTDNGATWTSANALQIWDNTTTPSFADISTTGEHITIDLTSYSGTVKLGFYAESTVSNADNDLFVDNVQVREIPSYLEPTNLTATDIGIKSAYLGWTENNTPPATTWDIEYGATPFTPIGIPTFSTITNPHNLTGLTISTEYAWYVRADCGSGNYSTWTGPNTFTTSDGKAINPDPPNNAMNVDVTAKTFDWDDVIDSFGYTIKIGTATGLSDIVNNANCPTSTYTFTGADWDYNDDYYWTITTYYTAKDVVIGDEWKFTTKCEAISTFPWTEGFEGMASVGAGVIPDCMAEDGDWTTADAPSTYNRQPRTGSKYIYTNYYADDWLFSVPFDLTVGTSYDFLFWYITDGLSGWTTLEVKYGTGQTSGDMTTAIGTPVSGPTNTTYVEYRGTFVPSSTGTYYIGIHVVCDNYTPWYISFDDLKLELTPSCPAPTNPYTDAITDTGANFNWTAGGTEPNWNIEWGAAGFVQGTGTMISNTTDNPYTLTGLSSATMYDWYVQADCDGGTSKEESAWAGPSTFTTTGSYSLPYYQDFATWLPADWTISGGTNWIQGTGAFAGGTAPEAKFYWFPGTVATQRLISPPIDTQGETSINIEFRHFLDWFDVPFTIMLQTTSNGGVTWNTTSFNHVNPVGDIGPEFQSIMVNNADVGSENFQCAFVFDGDSYNLDNWYVDDVAVIVSPPPTLEITPSPYDFGNVPYNKTPTQVFTLSNIGVGTVTVNSASAITLSGDPEFTIVGTYFSNTPGVIPPDTVTVEVQFAPGAEIGYSTVLSVVWAGSVKSQTDVTLTGDGCTPVANDDCVNATPIVGPYPVSGSGSNECAYIDCPGLLDWNTIWYEIELPYGCNDVEITICAVDTDPASVGIILMDDCACDDYIVRQDGLGAGWITCPSTFLGYNMIFPSITGPTTMLWPAYLVGADGGIAFDYEINVTPCVTPNAPEDINVVVAGSNVTVSWTYHSELTYTVYSDTDPYGTFITVEGTGIAADHLDITPIPGVPTFYRVTCDNPPKRMYSDGIGITEQAPKVIAPTRTDPSNQSRKRK